MLAGAAAAQPATPLPASLRGLVHRTRAFGCGQAWEASEAWSETTLTLSGRRARLVVDGHFRDASGGVDGLLGGGPYHTETDHHARIEWSGRARRAGAALTIALHALVETRDVEGAPTTITNHTTLDAELTCAREERDVLASARPTDLAHEPVLGRRTLVACTFAARPSEGPLPRPVAELLTLPFLLSEGAGITTDADYPGYVTATAPYLVAREPGGFPLPPQP